MSASTKKRLLWAGGILLVLAVGMGVYYAGQAKRTLDQVTQPGASQREVSVYVLADDPAQDLSDAAGYLFGSLAGEEEAVARLEEALGGSPAVEEYPTAFALADALQQGACGAVLLEESYQLSLSDAQGYEWTAEGMRRLGAVSLPQEFLLYLSGSDTFGDISTLSRSDVNILAAVDTRAKRLLLVATPRDFYVSFSQTGGAKDKLTHAGIYGIQASVDALETLYGVEIDYTLRMNFTGFVEIIDALGGVSVYSDREFTVENIRTYRQGYNQLTGIEALAFARERMSFPEGDYQRAKNQMEVIRAVVEKASSPALVQNLPAVLEAVSGNFETNMPQAQILALGPQLSGDWDIQTYTASGESAYRETWSMPGQELYVILPDGASVEEASERLRAFLKGE